MVLREFCENSLPAMLRNARQAGAVVKSMNQQLVAVLDNIRSLYNVGAIFRTADAFGVDHLYLCGMTGRPDDELTGQRIHKTALGAEESVAWSYIEETTDAIKQLKSDGYTILALEQTPQATSVFDYSLQPTHYNLTRLCLVVGHEVYGVSQPVLALADHHIQIPMLGQKESLNVSVAFGIAASWLVYCRLTRP